MKEVYSPFSLHPSVAQPNWWSGEQGTVHVRERGLRVYARLKARLSGKDGMWASLQPAPDAPNLRAGVSVEQQVDDLVRHATSLENLSRMYEGWTSWI